MARTLDDKLVVAISSRALFNFEEENRVFVEKSPQQYMALQWQRLGETAPPGVAFSLVNKLLAFNADGKQRVEVVILSRNDPVSGMRVFRSTRAHGMDAIQSGVFTQGEEPYSYLRALGAHLFLSANADDVRRALELGFPAAQVATESHHPGNPRADEVRIAFDGDAVLFSDEAEQVFASGGLDAFQAHEVERAALPLPPGPFKPFLDALQRLQKADVAGMRIRTALVTARGAPANERPLLTLRHWNITVDEAMFLGGLDKGAFLHEFEPDFFFDDQSVHVNSAARYVPAGHVSSGIRNRTATAPAPPQRSSGKVQRRPPARRR